jgi:hypothetical protein
MNPIQVRAFYEEIDLTELALAACNTERALFHLERAHVLGQTDVVPHVITHWMMLKLEWIRGGFVALLGQSLRVLLGALGSAVGIGPIENTGGTNISMFKRLPIATDLQSLRDGREQTAQSSGDMGCFL